jgi:hypothetical protein
VETRKILGRARTPASHIGAAAEDDVHLQPGIQMHRDEKCSVNITDIFATEEKRRKANINVRHTV